jgi:hypothetical protein
MPTPELHGTHEQGTEDLVAHFNRYIGIDYSGAETADSSCKGIRVFMAEGANERVQVPPPPSPRRYWTRRGLAEWLREELDRDISTLVGIDHAFSFPLAYFEKYRLSSDWHDFLVDFQKHWPTDASHTYVARPEKNRRTNVAPNNGEMDSCREICLRVRSKWRGCDLDARWSSLAPPPSQTMQTPCTLLAFRRVGDSQGQIGRGRGLSIAVDAAVPKGRPGRR